VQLQTGIYLFWVYLGKSSYPSWGRTRFDVGGWSRMASRGVHEHVKLART